jgi:hypothetical protein
MKKSVKNGEHPAKLELCGRDGVSPSVFRSFALMHFLALAICSVAYGEPAENRVSNTVSATGNSTPPSESFATRKELVRGILPIRIAIPADAKRFTITINDSQGHRVRNLIGDADPADYELKNKDKKSPIRIVEVGWDCLDDHGGLVRPGSYYAVALTHKGLSATYEMSFYNPGNPPWATNDGSGAWGSDLCPPHLLAVAGKWMIIGWEACAAGSGIIGLDVRGQKRWGESHGVTALAADEKYVDCMLNEPDERKSGLARIAVQDGSRQPFVVEGQPWPVISMQKIFDSTNAVGNVTGMSVHGNRLVLALSDGRIALLDAETAKLIKTIDAPKPQGVAFGSNGKLYALLDGGVREIDLDIGTLLPVPTPGVTQATAMAVDRDGNIVVADCGPDCQVKAFRPDGKSAYSCGIKGGRPIRGEFEKNGMRAMSSVAVDDKGRVWVAESSEYPRRVSVWGRDGRLVCDYIGNAAHSGVGAYLHDEDPDLGYYGPCEFKLNRKHMTWDLTRVLWVPDAVKNEYFPISPSPAGAQIFTSKASGTKRTYLYSHDGPQVVYMKRNGGWQPVAALCQVYQLSGRIDWRDTSGKNDLQPSGQFAGMNLRDGLIWNDKNKDGQLTLDECVIIAADSINKDGHGPQARLKLGDGIGGRIGGDLCIFVDGLTCYRPQGFTDDGAPLYGKEGITEFGMHDGGDLAPVSDEGRLLVLSQNGHEGSRWLRCLDTKSSIVSWEYPSCFHVGQTAQAPMPKPGMMIQPVKLIGTAHINSDIGTIAAIRGNLGEDYFLTTDGLYVGALFSDSRLSPVSMPEKPEKKIKGMQMDSMSEGNESFNGWFGIQSDGVIRLVNAMAGNAATILQVHGLDTIRRCQGVRLDVDPVLLVKAEQENIACVSVNASAPAYTVKRLAASPRIDAKSMDWSGIPAMTIEREGTPSRGTAKVAYDDVNLYVLFEVEEPDPWQNEGRDFRRLFKTGDAMDIQFNVNPQTAAQRSGLLPSDVRIVFSRLGDRPVAVLMKPLDPAATVEKAVKYRSPVGERLFDSVEIMPDAQVSVRVDETHCRLEAAIPLKSIGLAPRAGMSLRGDAGIISADVHGRADIARTYWSNKLANIVNDDPTEAWLYPTTWGEWRFE